jgi:hypothetical protein
MASYPKFSSITVCFADGTKGTITVGTPAKNVTVKQRVMGASSDPVVYQMDLYPLVNLEPSTQVHGKGKLIDLWNICLKNANAHGKIGCFHVGYTGKYTIVLVSKDNMLIGESELFPTELIIE